MFTGIIEGVGKVQKVEDQNSSRRLWIQSPFSLRQEKPGDSIAVNGCCLTIIQKNKNSFAADVSPETLERTSLGELVAESLINLERPLRLQDRLGGHLVQGHVDGVGKIKSIRPHQTPQGNYLFLNFSYPSFLKKYLVEKGSITIDGISLTLNRVWGTFFEVCIIPHTQALTTLTHKKPGARVNLEVDVMAKYLEKLISRPREIRQKKK